MAITILCTTIKRTKDYDAPKNDFGMGLKSEPKEAWIVSFRIEMGGRKIKPALTYETESEARQWAEGKTYEPLEWAQLAFW